MRFSWTSLNGNSIPFLWFASVGFGFLYVNGSICYFYCLMFIFPSSGESGTETDLRFIGGGIKKK